MTARVTATDASGVNPRWCDREQPWRKIDGYEAWRKLWDAARTFEEATGLIHALIEDERSDDPRAIRFLIEVANPYVLGRPHACSGYGGKKWCPYCKIQGLAWKIFFTRFLRDPEKDPTHPPSWATPFEKDTDLLGVVLAFFLEHRFELRQEPEPELGIVRAFLRRWADDDLWPRRDTWREYEQAQLARVRIVREEHRVELYRALLRFDLDLEIRSTDASSLAALRTLALEESSPERRPRDIDEALVWTSGLNGCHKQAAQRLLYLEHLARASARQERERRAAREQR